MEFRKTLSEILEKEIKTKYRSIRQFSIAANIPYMTIVGVIKRGVENTTVGTLQKICDALEITINDLYRKQATDTIFFKIETIPEDQYTNKDIINDLFDSKLIDIRKQHYTDEQLNTMAQNYRFFVSGDWLFGSDDND